MFFLFLFPQFFLKSNYFIQIWWNLSLWHCLCSIIGMCEWRRQAAARRGSARLVACSFIARAASVFSVIACVRRVCAGCARATERACGKAIFFCYLPRVDVSIIQQTNEQTNARTNERMNQRTNERTNKRTNKRTNERTNEQTNERTNERTNAEQTNRKSEGKSVFESFKLLDYTNF